MKAVLREHVQFAVRDDRTRKQQLVPRLIADVVHPLALGGAVLLQLVRLVRDHQVGVVSQQAATPIRNLRPRPASPRPSAWSAAPFSLPPYP